MKVGEFCKRSVVTIGPTQGLTEAARLMRDQHVGFLVVVEQKGGGQVPVGVLTDRDIIVQVNAEGVDPNSLTAADVMTPKPVIATEQDDIAELIRGLRTAGIRRAPVVDDRGRLVGIIALDDAFDVVTNLMCDMCGTVRNEIRMEKRVHPTHVGSA